MATSSYTHQIFFLVKHVLGLSVHEAGDFSLGRCFLEPQNHRFQETPTLENGKILPKGSPGIT